MSISVLEAERKKLAFYICSLISDLEGYWGEDYIDGYLKELEQRKINCDGLAEWWIKYKPQYERCIKKN